MEKTIDVIVNETERELTKILNGSRLPVSILYLLIHKLDHDLQELYIRTLEATSQSSTIVTPQKEPKKALETQEQGN